MLSLGAPGWSICEFCGAHLFDIMHKGDIQKRHRKTDFTLLAE